MRASDWRRRTAACRNTSRPRPTSARPEAALGHLDRAVELLRAAAESSGDPDPAGQLARVLTEAGRPLEASPWRERAARGFEPLLARHREAFADHAAEFWLGAGHDPVRALALARWNLDLRPTPRARELARRCASAVNKS
jgi:hypothetical protein